MKIGVISLVPRQEPLWVDEFVSPITKIISKKGHEFEIIPYDTKIENFQSFDKFILSGSPLGNFEANSHLEHFRWIRRTRKPILGICAGMQIIGQLYGFELTDEVSIGLEYVKPIADNPFFDEEIQTYQLHTKKITGKHPSFEVFAQNSQGIQGIQHQETHLYGVLFHPEVRNPKIIEKFLNL